jgi:RND family efflux transporter MFP subunit
MKKTTFFILVGLLTSVVSRADSASGLVFPLREVILSSPVQNFITELQVREGAEVAAGDQLAQLYVKSVELDMERAAAALRKRQFESQGAQNLFREKLISEDEALASEIELRLAQLQFEIAQEAVRLRQIRSPISGIIVERNNEIGEMVSVGEPMFRVVDLDQIYVRLYLSVAEARDYPVGRAVLLTFPELQDDAPALKGIVDFIDPRVDSASGLLEVKILADNSDRSVKPGMRARVELAPPSTEVSVDLPEESLPGADLPTQAEMLEAPAAVEPAPPSTEVSVDLPEENLPGADLPTQAEMLEATAAVEPAPPSTEVSVDLPEESLSGADLPTQAEMLEATAAVEPAPPSTEVSVDLPEESLPGADLPTQAEMLEAPAAVEPAPPSTEVSVDLSEESLPGADLPTQAEMLEAPVAVEPAPPAASVDESSL